MLKRYSTFGKYKEKMFVLKSSGIGYYNMDPGKMKFIEFDSQTRIDEDVGSEQASKFRKFRIVTLERVLNLATLDKRWAFFFQGNRLCRLVRNLGLLTNLSAKICHNHVTMLCRIAAELAIPCNNHFAK